MSTPITVTDMLLSLSDGWLNCEQWLSINIPILSPRPHLTPRHICTSGWVSLPPIRFSSRNVFSTLKISLYLTLQLEWLSNGHSPSWWWPQARKWDECILSDREWRSCFQLFVVGEGAFQWQNWIWNGMWSVWSRWPMIFGPHPLDVVANTFTSRISGRGFWFYRMTADL